MLREQGGTLVLKGPENAHKAVIGWHVVSVTWWLCGA